MSRGGTKGQRTFVQPGVRSHAMKYNVDNHARRRLKVALQTLADHDDALRLALVETCVDGPGCVTSVRIAIERLVYGANGEFR